MSSLLVTIIIAVTSPMPLSLATTDDALSVMANPAGLGGNRGWQFYYLYNYQPKEFISNSTFLIALGPLAGFVEPKPLRYGLALGCKREWFSVGGHIITDTIVNCGLGLMIRPNKWLSVGGVWDGINQNGGRPGLGVALRPIGPKITFFSETFIHPLQYFAGFHFQPVMGVQLDSRVQIDQVPNFALGFNVGFGNLGLGVTGVSYPREVASWIRFTSDPRPALVPVPKQYLELKISEPIVELKPGLNLTGLSKARTCYAVLELIKKAAQRENIKGLLIKLENEEMDFSFAGELRRRILDFRLHNKKVILYAQNLGMIGFYIASAADLIVLNPMGNLIIPGISLYSTFIKGVLDKLDLKVGVYRHGKYKSAVEVFTEDSMSAENQEQLMAVVENTFNEFLLAVSSGRNLPTEKMEGFINKGFFRAEIAKQLRLIDTLLYEDQLDSLVSTYFSRCRSVDEKKFIRLHHSSTQWQQIPQIAVIYILGRIVSGESGTNFLTGEFYTGAKTVCRAIREAARKKQIKGIILRVNSPGGDGVASELIWREITKVKGKKPVVVTMGRVAASGGYYVSCNADQIFALPNTITGSIGVFSLRFITEGLYNKVGIKRQIIKKGEHADILSDYRAATFEEDSIFQNEIDWFYQHFVQRVAQGRNMNSEQVDSIAQGRIWTGIDAHRIGLVDSLGGFIEAVDYCRRMAKVGEEYELVFYPEPRTGIAALIDRGIELIWERLVK